VKTMELVAEVVDTACRRRAVEAFAARKIRLPTFRELAAPRRMSPARREAAAAVHPDDAAPENLFRVHWWNDADRRGLAELPGHVVLPSSFTGVDSPIVVLFGDRFPMIGAHKVLAAYACLVPRIVTGRFDPTHHRALFPSTGNYCRGGVAIARILGCRGVAILPAEMSAERFTWLERWVQDPSDIIRTPGSESNVKEIYDACARLAEDPQNVILNQFAEFANHLGHATVTSAAVSAVYEHLRGSLPDLRLAAFVSASGSAGTLGAGRPLRERFGTKVVAVEALECPTLLANGFGSHHIQGIGDKHVPLIHDVMGTDVVVGVSDRATDALYAVAATEEGRSRLTQESEEVRAALPHFGFSSYCNVLAAIKTAKALGLGRDDALFTVATDGAGLYASELPRILDRMFEGEMTARGAEVALGRYLHGASAEAVRELDHAERTRILNLGYFTWVEQQGVSLEDFERRRDPRFWDELRAYVPAWDRLIEDFDREVGEAIQQ
jgi:cysteine synthase A